MTPNEWAACTEPHEMLAFLRGRASERKLRLFACACCRALGARWPELLDPRCLRALELMERYADEPADGVVGEAYQEADAAFRAAGPVALHARRAVKLIPGAEWRFGREDPYLATAREVSGDLLLAASAQGRLDRLLVPPCDWDMAELGATGWGADALRRGRERFEKDNRLPYGEEQREEKWINNWREWVWRDELDDAARAAERQVKQEHCRLLRCLFVRPALPALVLPRLRSPTPGAAVRLAHLLYDERALGRLPQLADALRQAGCDDPAILGHLRSPEPHALGCWALDLVLGKE